MTWCLGISIWLLCAAGAYLIARPTTKHRIWLMLLCVGLGLLAPFFALQKISYDMEIAEREMRWQ